MNSERPVNLDLTKFHFPPMAIVSILHRIAGVVLFLYVPVIIGLLYKSLSSPADFQATIALLHNPGMGFVMWIFLCALFYHIIAGMRHLLMDFGVGESLCVARASAYTVFILAIISFILAGVWVW